MDLSKKKKKDESFWEIGVKESGILKHGIYGIVGLFDGLDPCNIRLEVWDSLIQRCMLWGIRGSIFGHLFNNWLDYHEF